MFFNRNVFGHYEGVDRASSGAISGSIRALPRFYQGPEGICLTGAFKD